MDLHKILVAVDFSPDSEPAIDAALALVDGAHTQVVLFHVCELPAYSTPGRGVYIPAPDLAVEHLTMARRRLDEIRARCAARGSDVDIACVSSASVAAEIVDYASTRNFDLIVIGSHGRRGLRRLVLGSVAERVVQTADRPVLTVHEHDRAWSASATEAV